MIFRRRASSLVHAAWGGLIATGLFLSAQARAQECDSSVTFVASFVEGTTYTFTPLVPAQDVTVLSTEWSFVSEDATTAPTFLPEATHTFPGPGIYLVCMHCTVLDALLNVCEATHCELVLVPGDPMCADVEPYFTIGLEDGLLTFFDQSFSSSPITSYQWDLGDGTTGTGPSLGHSYSGTGPYQVCLTITSGPCIETFCAWVYFGPSEVPCETLLQADFNTVQVGRTVAVFDQSLTSGMYHEVRWDFGDGTIAQGPAAIHTYPDESERTICSDIVLWGPLSSDTCEAETCKPVSFLGAVGIDDRQGRPALHASPVPFTDALDLRGTAVVRGARWAIADALGRVVEQGSIASDGAGTIRLASLAPGHYVVRLTHGRTVSVCHVVKQ